MAVLSEVAAMGQGGLQIKLARASRAEQIVAMQ
jgi:hypothetical protein